MAQPIFFRIGTSDHITLRGFITGLHNFLGILEDIDSALSNDPQGSMQWEVSSLQKSSPPIIGVTPSPRRANIPDLSGAIEAQLLNNTRSLTVAGERNEYMPDAALIKMKKLARATKRIGPSAVYVNGEARKRQEGIITEQTFKNVSELTDAKFVAYGSVIGKLESIYVHKGNEFRVWDRKTGKPVRCIFTQDRESQVKDLLRETVLVAGMVHSNSAGMPIKLELEELEPFTEKVLPTIEEMSGIVDDFTGGRTLKEYLKELEDD